MTRHPSTNISARFLAVILLLMAYLPNRFNVGWRLELFNWDILLTDWLLLGFLVAFLLTRSLSPEMRLEKIHRRLGWTVVGWGGAGFVSTLFMDGSDVSRGQGFMALFSAVLWTAPVLIVPELKLSKNEIRRLLYVYAGLAALGAIVGVFQSVALETFSALVGWRYVYFITDSEWRSPLPLGVATVIGAFFVTAMPVGFFLAIKPGSPMRRLLGLATVFILGLGGLFTSSRATFLLILLVAAVSAVWMRWPGGTRLYSWLAAAGLAVTIAFAFTQFNFQRLTELRDAYGSTLWRIRGLESAAQMVREAPILGHGTEAHFRRQKAPVQGYFSTEKAHDSIFYDDRISPMEPHNLYLMVASEWGSVGLAFYLWMLGLVFLWFYRGMKSASDPEDRLWMKVFLIGFTAVLIHSHAGSDLVRQPRMAPVFWIYCGLGLSFVNHIRRERFSTSASAVQVQPPTPVADRKGSPP